MTPVEKLLDELRNELRQAQESRYRDEGEETVLEDIVWRLEDALRRSKVS